MGGTVAEIAAQRTAWDALAPAVAAQQKKLNAAQHQLALAAFQNIVTPASGAVVRPMIGQTSCASGSFNSYYKIQSDIYGILCFGGSVGTYRLTSEMSNFRGGDLRLSPGAYRGRVYYDGSSGTTSFYYWSVVRGPNDYNYYHFSNATPVYIVSVQFL